VINKGMMSSAKQDWETPKGLFALLHRLCAFTVDAASNGHNAKLPKHWTEKDDGLAQSWKGHRVWVNPPYGRHQKAWIVKAHNEYRNHGVKSALLIPARTDTVIWQQFIFDPEVDADVLLLKGRLKFEVNGKSIGTAPFPSAIIFFGGVPDHAKAELRRLGRFIKLDSFQTATSALMAG
jgi:site-specific DNA-methyltransferase (adenine-specific)